MMLRLRTHADAPGERDQIAYEFEDPLLELVRLLHEASEVEHALLVQYLYAAFSIKLPRYKSLAGSGFSASADDLLGVAIQEMQHLDVANRMLVAVGASPNLIRQDFPYEPAIYPFEFNVEPMSRQTLAKYVWTEAPSDDPFLQQLEPVLGKLEPNHLGSLYATIIDLTETLIATGADGLDLTPWPPRLRAVKGEGEIDHFTFFKAVFLGTHSAFGGVPNVWDLPTTDANYPARPLQINPTAFGGRPNTIDDDTARALAWLSDLHYWIVLVLLDISYRYDSPTAKFLAQDHMMGPLLELGRHLASHGCGTPFDPLSLGYNLGRDKETSKRILGHLLDETAETQTATADLPPNYSIDTARDTLSRLPDL